MDVLCEAAKLARGIAQLSECKRDKVGAVLLDLRSATIIGTGYNDGSDCTLACPRGRYSLAELPHNEGHNDPATICNSRHAEIAAIEDAGLTGVPEDAEPLLVVTRIPCPICAPVLARLGIAYEVV